MAVLPKPETLKKQKKASAIDHAKSTINALADEEIKIGKRLNLLRVNHDAFKAQVDTERQELTEAHKAFVSSLKDEVSSLEQRKEEALKKVVDRTEEFRVIGEKLDARAEATGTLEAQAENTARRLDIRESELDGREKLIQKHIDHAKSIVDNVKEQEDEMRKRHIAFDDEKKRHEKDILTREMELTARKNDVIRAERSVEAREKTVQAHHVEIHDKTRRLDSDREALNAASEEIEKRKKK